MKVITTEKCYTNYANQLETRTKIAETQKILADLLDGCYEKCHKILSTTIEVLGP